jgi:hypothetical protein
MVYARSQIINHLIHGLDKYVRKYGSKTLVQSEPYIALPIKVTAYTFLDNEAHR